MMKDLLGRAESQNLSQEVGQLRPHLVSVTIVIFLRRTLGIGLALVNRVLPAESRVHRALPPMNEDLVIVVV